MARTASTAATTGGAIRTIPGPPPNGRSSTCLCFPSAQSRMSQRSTATSPLAIARFRMLSLRKPSKSAGNSVSTSKRSGGGGIVGRVRSLTRSSGRPVGAGAGAWAGAAVEVAVAAGVSGSCQGSPGAGFFTPCLFKSTCTFSLGWAPTESQ